MYINKADELLNLILNMSIPEIDLDQYHISMNISADDYANKKATEFKMSSSNNFSSSQIENNSSSHIESSLFKSPSSDGGYSDDATSLSAAGTTNQKMTKSQINQKSGQQIVYQFESKDKKQDDKNHN